MISTVNSGAASLASTQARAGVLPAGTQASQTEFISSKVDMSASQMVAGRYDVLCQPRNAEKARELLAKLAMGPGATGAPRS